MRFRSIIDEPRRPRFVVPLLLSALLFATTVFASAAENEAERKKTEGEKIVAEATAEITREPGNASAFLRRARAHATLEETEAAISDYDRFLEIEPENQEARTERGDLHFKKGDLGKAMTDYEDLRTSQGEASAAKSQQEYAAQAAAMHPFRSGIDPTQLILQAESLVRSGQTNEAIQIYDRLLDGSIAPESASAILVGRGSVYLLQGNIEQARRDYDLALRRNPANAAAYVSRGFLLAQAGDIESAKMDFNEALRFEPKNLQALVNRAAAQAQDGNLDAAEDDLTRAIQLQEKFAPTYVERARVFLIGKKHERALADLNRALALDPKLASAYLVRAQLPPPKRAHAQRLSDLETAGRLDSTLQAAVLNNLAWLRATCPDAKFRNGKKAVAEAIRACELTRWENAGSVDTLAAAYAESGAFEKAVNFQYYALSLPGFSPEARPAAEARLPLYQSRHPYRETEPTPPAD